MVVHVRKARLKDAQKVQLYDWLRANEQRLVDEKMSVGAAAEQATAALQIAVSRQHVRGAISALGLAWRGQYVRGPNRAKAGDVGALREEVAELRGLVEQLRGALWEVMQRMGDLPPDAVRAIRKAGGVPVAGTGDGTH